MSTFYLLPPRPVLGERLAGLLHDLFPGLDWDTTARANLAEALAAAATGRNGVFVAYREDLPEGEPAARALADGYGAEAGDEVVEVRPGPKPGELTARRWRLAI
jgi:hypothetical protein